MNSIMEGLVNDLDTEKFINAVKQHPSIWDMNHEDHGDREVKKLAWDTVISTFVGDYEDKSAAEKKNLGNAFSRKWKSLRDCYSRELGKKRRESQSGSGVSHRKEYVYFENLKFLGALKNINAYDDPDAEGSKDNDYDPDYAEEPLPKRTKRIGKPPKSINADKKAKIERKEVKSVGIGVDPDRLFMLSLVPEMKKIPDHLKLEVKSSLLSVFTNTLVRHNRTLRNEHNSHNIRVYNGGGTVPGRVTVPTVHVTVPISINYDSAHLQSDKVTNLQENLNPTLCKTDPANDVNVSDQESEFSE